MTVTGAFSPRQEPAQMLTSEASMLPHPLTVYANGVPNRSFRLTLCIIPWRTAVDIKKRF
jgi:hypothetical protein